MGRRRGSPAIVDREQGMKNLSSLFDKSPVWERQMGKDYFHNLSCMVDVISTRLSVNFVTCAAVYAALSPNNSEESNLLDAEAALRAYKAGQWSSLRVHTYGANKAKALRIIEGEDPDMVLRGLKTNNFFNNVVYPQSHNFVTVDGHMVNAWNGKRVPLDFAGISKGEYEVISRGIRELANGKWMVPCQMQAILWLAWRRIHWIKYNPQLSLNFKGE